MSTHANMYACTHARMHTGTQVHRYTGTHITNVLTTVCTCSRQTFYTYIAHINITE